MRKYLRGIHDQEEQLRRQAQHENRDFRREDGMSIYMEYELQEAKKVLRDEAARGRRLTGDKPLALGIYFIKLKLHNFKSIYVETRLAG